MEPYVHKAVYSDQNRPREGELGIRSEFSVTLISYNTSARLYARRRHAVGINDWGLYTLYATTVLL